MSIPFEFVVSGPVVSQQARRSERREAWKEKVQHAAREAWDSAQPTPDSVSVTITHFFAGREPDVDNIPKPILDAMNGLVYTDDRLVADLWCRKRNLGDDLLIRNPPSALIEYLQASDEVVHIRVDAVSISEVVF